MTYTIDPNTNIMTIYGTPIDGGRGVGREYKDIIKQHNIVNVVIVEGVTSIGEMAFSWCSNLTSVIIPNGVTSIGKGAFEGCSALTSATIPSSVTSTGESAFAGCSSLSSVTIPNGVTSIGQNAFNGCSDLTSVNIPNSVTSIGEVAFYRCAKLTSVTIPNGVTSIGDFAFYNCSSLASVNIPNSVTSIGQSAFGGCSSLTSVNIPNSVTSIGPRAFVRCTSLTSIALPKSLTADQMNVRCFSETNLDVVFLESGSTLTPANLVSLGAQQSVKVIELSTAVYQILSSLKAPQQQILIKWFKEIAAQKGNETQIESSETTTINKSDLDCFIQGLQNAINKSSWNLESLSRPGQVVFIEALDIFNRKDNSKDIFRDTLKTIYKAHQLPLMRRMFRRSDIWANLKSSYRFLHHSMREYFPTDQTTLTTELAPATLTAVSAEESRKRKALDVVVKYWHERPCPVLNEILYGTSGPRGRT